MRKASALFVALAVVSAATVASAAPIAYYTPATGNIKFYNDTGSTLGAIFLQSTAGTNVKTDAGAFAQVPGATFDPGDLPLGFTYLGFPTTPTGTTLQEKFAASINIGNVILPNTPVADLTLGAYATLSPLVVVQGTSVVEVPEPATMGIAGIASLIGLAVRRRMVA